MVVTVDRNRWVRNPEDFAVDLRQRDISGLFKKAIFIEEGTIGLHLIQGRFDKRLEPGEHLLEGAIDTMILGGRDRNNIVLIHTEGVMVEINLPRLLTVDPVPFSVQVAISLQFASGREAAFLSNFMLGKESLTTNDIRHLVFAEINEGAQIWAGKHTIKEMAEDLTLRDDLALSLEAHIKPVLDRHGLSFGRMEVRDFKCEVWDRSVSMRVEASLQVTEEQAKLEGRKRLFDFAVESDIQDITEETQKTATYEKRIQLWDRMARAANQEEINKITNEEQLVDFIRENDRDRLLKEEDFDNFKTALRETGEDRERLRAQLIRIANMEGEYEYRRKELFLQEDLSREELEGQLGLERIRVESQMETELKRTDLELERQRRESDYARTEDERDAATRWHQEIENAKASAAAENASRDSARLDGEMVLALEAQREAQQRLDQQESVRIDLDRQAGEQEISLKAQEAELDRQIRDLQERHRQELESMQSMDGVSLHTLIAVSSDEKAPILAELARTEALKSMSTEQILAIAAEKSPELGGALAEMAAKGGSDQAKEMYERILAEQKSAAADMRESQREMTETMKEMFNKALETQAQVAASFGQGIGQAAAGGAPPASGQASQRVVVCRRCMQESAAGTKHCPNCGETMMNNPS